MLHEVLVKKMSVFLGFLATDQSINKKKGYVELVIYHY